MKQTLLRLWIVRHGETEANQKQYIQGQSESPLTAMGISQANRLAKRLRGFRFDAVFSSDLSRAVDTATIIAPKNEIITLRHLRERALGPLEGKSFEEAEAEYPVLLAAVRSYAAAEDAVPESMETRTRLVARAGEALEDIRARCPEGAAVAVSHGGLLSAIFCHVIGPIPPYRPRVTNTSLSLIVHDGRRWQLSTWNDTLHLHEPGEPAIPW